MQEYPVLEDDTEGIGTPVEIPCLLGHIDSRSSSLDGLPSLIKCRIERLDIDGDLALVVEVGELLQADRVLVLNPRFDGRTTVIVPGIAGVHVSVLERQDNARNSAAVDAEIRDIDFQDICSLIGGADEIPYYDEEALAAINAQFKVDTVVTHTSPSFCELITKEGLIGWSKRDDTLLEDCEKERAILDRIFDTLFEAGQPLAHWFYGHFHQSWNASIYGVLFSMLDIMEFKEVLRE